MSIQRSAGNHAASRLIQRTHPAFNEVNFWRPSLPAVDGIPAQPAPGSPAAVLIRLKAKFSEQVAQLLLYTDAEEQDAVAREPMTAKFLAEGGTNAEAIQFLTAAPRDNAALQLSYTQCIDAKRQGVTNAFVNQGGSPVEATRLQVEHPAGVAPLELAYHEDRLGPLRERATAALTGLSKLESARWGMEPPANPGPVQITAMRFGIQDGIQRISRTREGSSREDLLREIQTAEAWIAAREATLATITAQAREIIKDSYALYREARVVVNLLFKADPFDAGAFDVAYKQWLAQPPVTRLSLKSPKEIMDALAGKLAAAWAISDDAARPYAVKLVGKGKSATIDTLATNHIPKATWDALEARLTLDETIAAVEHKDLTTDAKLQALITRLDQSALTGANLTAIALAAPATATLHSGRFFRYNADGTIETEVSVSWNKDLYMPPGRLHWGEIHIHYTGTVAAPANVSYVHVKLDRTIPGGTPIGAAHPVVAHVYANGLVDPTWHL